MTTRRMLIDGGFVAANSRSSLKKHALVLEREIIVLRTQAASRGEFFRSVRELKAKADALLEQVILLREGLEAYLGGAIGLTWTERQVVLLVRQHRGAPLKQLADQMVGPRGRTMTLRMLKWYLSNAYRKLGIQGRAEL